MLEKIKGWIGFYSKDAFLVAVIILTAFLGFGLGRLSRIEENKVPIVFHDASTPLQSSHSTSVQATANRRAVEAMTSPSSDEVKNSGPISGTIVASKNGTTYYTKGCAGERRISEKNKLTFATESAAVTAGYSKAASCK